MRPPDAGAGKPGAGRSAGGSPCGVQAGRRLPTGSTDEGLNELEQQLIRAIAAGETLDLAEDEPVDLDAMRSWGPERMIRASVLRDIVRGRLVADPDPRGLSLRGALVEGAVDLANISSRLSIELIDCYLREGLLITDASLLRLVLSGSWITQPPGSAAAAIQGSRLTTQVLALTGSTVAADSPDGAVVLLGAHVGCLDLTQAHLSDAIGPALDAGGLQMGGDLVLRDVAADGGGDNGTVCLIGADLGGSVNCSGSRLTNTTGPALQADGLHTGGDVILQAVTADGSGSGGTVRLVGARIGGQLHCGGAQLTNTTGPAVEADGMRADQGLFLCDRFAAAGGVRLPGGVIGGQWICHQAQLVNDLGPALEADGVQVDGAVLLRGTIARGSGGLGTVRMVGARVRQLECDRTQLTNSSGPGLVLADLQSDQEVLLRDGLTVTANGTVGAVCLMGARIGGKLDCGSARLENTSGPALAAQGIKVGQQVLLHDGFTAIGSGAQGTIDLLGARVGALECHRARMVNSTGTALHAESLQVTDSLIIREVTATGGGPHGVIVLLDAHVGGELWLDTGRVSSADGPLLNLDGATYSGLPKPMTLPQWLTLLREKTPAYAAQPYQQLAAVHRAAGHDHEVREILIAQRDAQLARGAIAGWDRIWARITKACLGYGYQPWRALLLLVAVLMTSMGAALIAGHQGGLARAGDATTSCTTIEQIGVGLDLGTALLTTGSREVCTPTTTAAGQALTVAGWALQVLAWAFAALFIAGFTSAVRKN